MFDYSLDVKDYTWKNALCWGNFLGHCKKAGEGSFNNRLVHILIAIAEFFPIVSQISSIFEKLIIDNFSYSKSTTHPFTDKEISVKPDLAATQSISQISLASNKSDTGDKSQVQKNETDPPVTQPIPQTSPASNKSDTVDKSPVQKNETDPPVTQPIPQTSPASNKSDTGDKSPVQKNETDPPVTQPIPQISPASNKSDTVDKSPVQKKEKDLCNSLNFQHCPGRHTIKSPVVGSRADELLAVKEAIKSETLLAKLQDAIYIEIFIYLIPITKKDEADEIARGLFLDYISKYTAYGCTEQNIVNWSYSGMPGCVSNKNHLSDLENEFNTWFVHAVIEARHGNHNEKYNRYLPPHVVAYHEVMHTEETPPKAKEATRKEDGVELLTTTKTIILLDTVYKKIHGIEEVREVDYDKFIDINGTRIKLGRFANFYREKESELGKLYLALISPESIKFLKGTIQ